MVWTLSRGCFLTWVAILPLPHFAIHLSGLTGKAEVQSSQKVDLLNRNKREAVHNASLEALESTAKPLSIFCFAWTSRRAGDEKSYPHVQKQLEHCDDHRFFTDNDAPGPDIGMVKVHVPVQPVLRSNKGWLQAKNMAGLMPSWTYLLEGDLLEEHDWVVQTEMDHFVRPSKVREGIEAYLGVLRRGTKHERNSLGKPIMLMWGNVFLFNKEMVREMRRQWSVIGKVQNSSQFGSGCPHWVDIPYRPGLAFMNACPQDLVYPTMAGAVMNPPVSMYGSSSCGKSAKNGLGEKFPLGCWNAYVQNPLIVKYGHSEAGQLAAIREIASMSTVVDGNNTDHQYRALFDSAASARRSRRVAVDEHASRLEAWSHSLQSSIADASLADRKMLSSMLDVLGHLRSANQDLAPLPLAFPDKQIPILHQVKLPSVHALAREVLGY